MVKIMQNLVMSYGGLLEFFVLKMLQTKTHSLREVHDQLANSGFKTSLGNIYPLFTKLRDKGYVASGYEESIIGTSLKTYQLTKKGHERLTDLKSDWKQINSFIARLGS